MDSEQIKNLIVDTLDKYATNNTFDSANKLLFKMYVRAIYDISDSRFEDIVDEEWNKYVEKYNVKKDDNDFDPKELVKCDVTITLDSDISKMSGKDAYSPSCSSCEDKDDGNDVCEQSCSPSCKPECPQAYSPSCSSCEDKDVCKQGSKTLSFEEAHKGIIRDDAMKEAKAICENRKTILKPRLSRDDSNQHFDIETFVQEFVKVKNVLRSIKFEKLGNKQYVNDIITTLNAYRRLLQ